MGRQKSEPVFDDNRAIASIYYYYLSLDKLDRKKKAKRLNSLFDIRRNSGWYLSALGLKTAGEEVPDADDDLERYLGEKLRNPEILENYSLAFGDFGELRESVITECESELSRIDEEDYYECLVEKIDNLYIALTNSNSNNIDNVINRDIDFLGNAVSKMWGAEVDDDLLNFPRNTFYFSRKHLLCFVIHTLRAGTLADNQRKYLSHFCRFMQIDKSVLSEMEETAKQILEIGAKRRSVQSGDTPQSEIDSALAELEEAEESAQQSVKSLLLLYDFDDDDTPEKKTWDDYLDINRKQPWYKDVTTPGERALDHVCGFLDRVADGFYDLASKI
jgi:hypothetical protein